MMKLPTFLSLSLSLMVGPALAQSTQWPPSQVTILVPFAAGATPDTIARVMADKLRERTGKTFIVENKPGASGNIAVAAVAKGPADGSLLGIGLLGALGLNKFLMSSMPYNPDKDIALATILVEQPNALVVSNELNVSSVGELIARLKANSGKFTYSSIGHGSLSHLAMELIASKSGTRITHLPMKASPEAAMAVMRNDVQMTVLPAISVLPLAREGKMKVLAVTSENRSDEMPDVPTFNESGINGVVAVAWNALIAPGSTPKSTLEEINSQATAVLKDPAVKELFAKQIMVTSPTTIEQARSYVDAELRKWESIIKTAGIEPQ